MSEFAEMIKEAILGEEPYRPDPDREALEASLARFDRRVRTVRRMAIFMVGATSAVFVLGLVALLRADETTSLPRLLLYASLFLWGSVAVGWGKLWFAMMHNHFSVMKELKSIQLRLPRDRGPG